jgi:hypothetical protein
VLLRLAYLALTNAFALLRPLPRDDRDKDAEILVLRHQIAVLQRQLRDQRIRFRPTDRALLAALLHPLPRPALRRLPSGLVSMPPLAAAHRPNPEAVAIRPREPQIRDLAPHTITRDLPLGRTQAGDRHLNFYEDRDTLRSAIAEATATIHRRPTNPSSRRSS